MAPITTPCTFSLRDWALLRRIACIISFLVVTEAPAAFGQRSGQDVLNRPVVLAAEQADMPAVLAELSRQSGAAILADGIPLRRPARLQAQGALKLVLDTVSEAFDVHWATLEPGVVLVSRRFRGPDERPQVVLPELKQMARDLLAILPDGPPDPNHSLWPRLLLDLANAVPQAQTEVLKQGGRIPVTTLAPAQQELVRRVIDARGYGVTRWRLERLCFQLDNLPGAQLAASRTPVDENADPRRPLVPPPAGRNATLVLVEQDKRGQTRMASVGSFVVGGASTVASPGDAPPPPKPTPVPEPAHQVAAGLDALVRLSVQGGAVAQLVEDLSRQAGLTVEASEQVRARRVTACVEGLSARRVLDALARLEGWKWGRDAKGVCRLSRSPAVRPAARTAVTRALRSALPTDLAAFMHLPDLARIDPLRLAGRFFDGRPYAQEAGGRLGRSIADSLVGGARVGWAELSTRQREDLVFALVMDAFQSEFGEAVAGWAAVKDMDPAQAFLRLEGGTVLKLEMVLNPAQNYAMGFGTDIGEVGWMRSGP